MFGKRFAAGLAVAALSAGVGLVAIASPASAATNCSLTVRTPYKSGTTIYSSVTMACPNPGDLRPVLITNQIKKASSVVKTQWWLDYSYLSFSKTVYASVSCPGTGSYSTYGIGQHNAGGTSVFGQSSSVSITC